MSEVRSKGVRRQTMHSTGFVCYEYKSPGVTLPHEKPDEWEEMSGEMKQYKLSPEELEQYRKK